MRPENLMIGARLGGSFEHANSTANRVSRIVVKVLASVLLAVNELTVVVMNVKFCSLQLWEYRTTLS